MKFQPKNIKRYQEGGVMPEETPGEEQPVENNQDPLMMLAEGAAQALQSQDCTIAMQVCLALLLLVQQTQGGTEEPQGEPVYRKGGIFLRRVRK